MEVTETEALRNVLNELLKLEDVIFAEAADVVTEPMKLRRFSIDNLRLRNECEATKKDLCLSWGILFTDGSSNFVPRPYISLKHSNAAFLSVALGTNGKWVYSGLNQGYFYLEATALGHNELVRFCEQKKTGRAFSESEAIQAAGIFARYFVFCLQQEI